VIDRQMLIVGITIVLLVLWLLSLGLKRFSQQAVKSGSFSREAFKYIGKEKFGQYLNIFGSIIGETVVDQGVMRFSYIVPEHLCHNHLEKRSFLDLGSLLALTDEITTVHVMSEDRTYRPGFEFLEQTVHHTD
jgi:hypothetical protein